MTKILATGDAMLIEPGESNWKNPEIENYIRAADFKITNLEMVPATSECHASTYCGGQWICTNEECVDALKEYGFDYFSCANNHSMDFSEKGLLHTCEILNKLNIPYSGIGRTLKEASAPFYYEVEDSEEILKKIAVISVTTTFIDAARAGDDNVFFDARPGVNALRHSEVYQITNEEMRVIKDIAAKTYINGERDNARKIGSLPKEKEGTFNFGGIFFEVSEHEGKKTKSDPRDLERILSEIRDAKTKADYVIISAHSHQIKKDKYTEPDYFFEEFCHKCIDEGACCVFGSGTHQIKPIEIYKKKPIFYSLGNFIFQLDKINKLPQDFWDKYGFSNDLSVDECLKIKSGNGVIGLEYDISNYLSFIPRVSFLKGDFIEAELLPISLNFDNQKKGLPMAASDEELFRIYNILLDIQKDYGCTLNMKIDGSVIKILV